MSENEASVNEANKSVALKFITAMSTNDPVLGDECLAPDAVAIAKGHGRFSSARPREMMLGVMEAFNDILPTGLNLTVTQVTAGDGRVAVECTGNGVASSGAAYRNEYCFVMSLRGGRIFQVNEYFCTKHADEVLWPVFEAAGVEAAK